MLLSVKMVVILAAPSPAETFALAAALVEAPALALDRLARLRVEEG